MPFRAFLGLLTSLMFVSACPSRTLRPDASLPSSESKLDSSMTSEGAPETPLLAEKRSEPPPEATPEKTTVLPEGSASEKGSPPETTVVKETSPEAQVTGIWGKDRMIDIHAHIGTFQGFDLSLATLLSNASRYGLSLLLVSNIDGANLPPTTLNLDETKANEATLAAVLAHPSLLRGLAWIRPKDGSAAKIEPFLRDSKLPNGQPAFVGLKFHPEMNQFEADDRLLDPYLRLCQTYKRPAVFHTGGAASRSAPSKIYAAARRFPTVPVILYHMSFDGSHQTSVQVAQDARQKKDALLFLETSQADPQAVSQAIQTLGASAVLFGTDATYYGKDHYGQYTGLITRLRSSLSAADFALVTRENARRLFSLP